MGHFVKDEVKKISEGEATYALREAWFRVYGQYPTTNSLALLWAQWALETGRGKAIHNYNFGNLKRGKDDPTDWTMFRCSEILNGREVFFDPPHPQTHFRAYPTAIDGALDYIKFLSKKTRYAKAWEAVKKGDPAEFSHELKVAGYYTANEARYTAIVVKLTEEFKSKAKILLEWRPTVILTPPPNKTAIDLANIPIVIPEPDLDSAPKEEPSVELKVQAPWYQFIIEFILVMIRGFKK